MLVWAFTRPLGDELTEGKGGEYPERGAPQGVDAATLASHERGPRPRRDGERLGGHGDTRGE